MSENEFPMVIDVPFKVQMALAEVGMEWLTTGQLEDSPKVKECMEAFLADLAGNEDCGDKLVVSSVESLAALHSFAEVHKQFRDEVS